VVRFAGSDQGHDTRSLQYLCVVVGCYPRLKVLEFAVSHEPHKAEVAANRAIGPQKKSEFQAALSQSGPPRCGVKRL
jgi:hypothetical protein